MNDTIALPGFAPLGEAKVLHLLGVSRQDFISDWQNLLPTLSQLEKKIASVRGAVFNMLFLRHVESGKLPVQWFCKALPQIKAEITKQPAGKPFSPKSVDNWRDSHALIFNGWGNMDPNSAASCIISFLVDEKDRHFLPTETPLDEPPLWCYSQEPPKEDGPTPIIPRPLPLPRNLAPGTLLWSPWPCFQSEWIQEPTGGISFAGALTPEILKRWDKTINTASLEIAFQENPRLAEKMLERLASSLLLNLSVGRLGVTPSLPLLWDSATIWPQEIVANS